MKGKERIVLFTVILGVFAIVGGGVYIAADTATSRPSVEDKNVNVGAFDSLQIETIVEGEGDREVTNGDTVRVHYMGWNVEGTMFDTSRGRQSGPFSFTVGNSEVIEGWEQGVIGMKVGEERRIKIPSDLAYGDQEQSPRIGANYDLIFDVELIGFADQANPIEEEQEQDKPDQEVEEVEEIEKANDEPETEDNAESSEQ